MDTNVTKMVIKKLIFQAQLNANEEDTAPPGDSPNRPKRYALQNLKKLTEAEWREAATHNH